MGITSWGLLFSCCAALLFSAGGSDFDTRERQIAERLLDLYEKNATFAREFDKTFPSETPRLNQTFPCTVIPPSETVPTSVHSLRPGDIKVVGALGDSITAGRGVVGGILGLLFDFRGKSWSGGGDCEYSHMSTIPNLLRKYNPDLYGYAQGVREKKSHFNVAVSGAKAGEMLEQAKELVSHMQADSNVDFANDWKLITIFIGGNDLCDFCSDRQKFSVATYINNIQSALDYLHANVPRAFINMVEVLNLEIVKELANNILCEAVHFFACDCAANPKSPAEEAELIQLRKGYQEATYALIASGRYDTRDDFTVVSQPFFRQTFVPKTESGKTDYSFFAADCFHFSKKGQEAAAEALWDNMFEPLGSKREGWTPGEVIECPSEKYPYLYTAKNSKDKRHPKWPRHL